MEGCFALRGDSILKFEKVVGLLLIHARDVSQVSFILTLSVYPIYILLVAVRCICFNNIMRDMCNKESAVVMINAIASKTEDEEVPLSSTNISMFPSHTKTK